MCGHHCTHKPSPTFELSWPCTQPPRDMVHSRQHPPADSIHTQSHTGTAVPLDTSVAQHTLATPTHKRSSISRHNYTGYTYHWQQLMVGPASHQSMSMWTQLLVPSQEIAPLPLEEIDTGSASSTATDKASRRLYHAGPTLPGYSHGTA
jgi:hypothetical protein